MVTNKQLQEMLDHCKADQALKEQIVGNFKGLDRAAIISVFKDGYFERFDRFDSHVCEKFIMEYQKITKGCKDIKYGIKCCSEFEALGTYEFDNIYSALQAYKNILKTNASSIPSLGIVSPDGSICDIIVGKTASLENINYYFEKSQRDVVLEIAKNLIEKYEEGSKVKKSAEAYEMEER